MPGTPVEAERDRRRTEADGGRDCPPSRTKSAVAAANRGTRSRAGAASAGDVAARRASAGDAIWGGVHRVVRESGARVGATTHVSRAAGLFSVVEGRGGGACVSSDPLVDATLGPVADAKRAACGRRHVDRRSHESDRQGEGAGAAPRAGRSAAGRRSVASGRTGGSGGPATRKLETRGRVGGLSGEGGGVRRAAGHLQRWCDRAAGTNRDPGQLLYREAKPKRTKQNRATPIATDN